MMFIKVKLRIPGTHQYIDASGSTEYLKNKHRHIFHFTVWIQVIDDTTREIEFIQVEENITGHMRQVIATSPKNFSCEFLATNVLNFSETCYGKNRAYRAEVTEDGLNGVLLERNGKE